MPTLPGRVAALRCITNFSACSPQELEAIARLVEEVDVGVADVLMQEGAPGRQSFVVLDGRAEIRVGGRLVATVGPGGMIGEMALIDGGVRTATVTALTPMRLLVIGPHAFEAMMDMPGVYRRMGRQLSDRLRTTLESESSV